MATYLIESYLADHPSAVENARTAARRAAEVAPGIRHLRTTFLPRDETVFHLFEAPSEADIRAAATTASLPIDRITEAVEAPAQVDNEILLGDPENLEGTGTFVAGDPPHFVTENGEGSTDIELSVGAFCRRTPEPS